MDTIPSSRGLTSVECLKACSVRGASTVSRDWIPEPEEAQGTAAGEVATVRGELEEEKTRRADAQAKAKSAASETGTAGSEIKAPKPDVHVKH